MAAVARLVCCAALLSLTGCISWLSVSVRSVATTTVDGRRVYDLCKWNPGADIRISGVEVFEVTDAGEPRLIWRNRTPTILNDCYVLHGDRTYCKLICEGDPNCIEERCPQPEELIPGKKYAVQFRSDSASISFASPGFTHSDPQAEAP